MPPEANETITPENAEAAEKGWIQTKFSQEEVNYTDYAVRRNPVNSVCQTCRWFTRRNDIYHDCHIVESFPLEIVGTGYCEKWTARKIVEPEPLAVVIVEDDDDDDEMEIGTMARIGVKVAPVVTDPIKARRGLNDTVKRLMGHEPVTSFKAIGGGLWIAFPTNNFEDREEEILRGDAHKRYVGRVKAGLVDMPELWRGHIRGTRHGKALHVDYLETDGVVTVFAIGEFDNTPEGKAAEQFYKAARPGDVSLSHGFVFPRWAKKDGQYADYNTFEITTLNRGQEANEFTNYEAKGTEMALTAAQRADIENVFGDAAPNILKRVEARGNADKALSDLGAKYKDFTDVTGEAEANKSGETPETIEAFKLLLPDLFEDSEKQLTLLTAMDKRLDDMQKKHEDERKQWATKIQALEKALASPASAASASDSTVIEGDKADEVEAEIAKKQTGKENIYADVFPGLFATPAAE